jgi:hypothetical protein
LCGKINKICGGKKKKTLVQKQLTSQLATLDFFLFLHLYIQISPCLKRAQWLEHLFDLLGHCTWPSQVGTGAWGGVVWAGPPAIDD